MKIDKVIMSCDSNPFYCDFWEPVSKVWSEYIGIRPVLVVVSDNIVNLSEKYGDVLQVCVDKGVPVHIQAQMARYWLPHIDPNTTFMTSDIDMIPCSRDYFIKSISHLPSDCFANLNANGRYLPACYNAAQGSLFSEILGINPILGDFCRKVLSECRGVGFTHSLENNGGNNLSSWGVDEEFCMRSVERFKDQSRIFRVPRPGGFCERRIDRVSWGYDLKSLKNGFYNACHCPRP